MKITKKVNINLISIDNYPINRKTLDLVDYMRKGNSIKPIKLIKNKNGGFIVKDGRHRITASKLLGIKTIIAKYDTIIPRHINN